MLKPIQNLLKDSKIKVGIAIFITVSIAILSLIKLGKQPISINNLDKIEHALAYFFLTLSWLFALGKTKRQLYVIVVLCFAYGIIIELLQANMTKYRTGELYDVIANSVGTVLAFAVFNSFFYKKRTI